MRCCYIHCIPGECVVGNHPHCTLNCDAKLSVADRALARDAYLKRRTLQPKRTLTLSRYVCCFECLELAYDGVHVAVTHQNTALGVCPKCYNDLTWVSKMKYSVSPDTIGTQSMAALRQWIQHCGNKRYLSPCGVRTVLRKLDFANPDQSTD